MKKTTLLHPRVVKVEYLKLTKTYCITLEGAEEKTELFTSKTPIEMFDRLALEVRKHKTHEL